MSDNVIPIRPDDEPFTYGIDGDDVAVVDEGKELEIGFLDGLPSILMSGYEINYKREGLAQILWAAAYLVDSEGRWRKEEYISKDYK